jgi:hypothetical protein
MVFEWARTTYSNNFPMTPFGWYAFPATPQQQLGMTMAQLGAVEAQEFIRLMKVVLEEGCVRPYLVPVFAENPTPVA